MIQDLKDVDPDLIRSGIRNLIKNISDFRTLTPSSIICLRYFARLFTYIFNDKFCEQFLKHLYQLTEVVCQNIRKGKDRDFKVKLQAVTQVIFLNFCKIFVSFFNVLFYFRIMEV